MRTFSVVLLASTFAGCSDEQSTPEPAARTVLGAPVALGQGEVRSFATLNPAGEIEELGVLVAELAMSTLPPEMSMISLSLPEELLDSGYDHLTLDWNPQGHVPAGIYDVPHFDVHFYQISEAERRSIAGGPEPTRLALQHTPPDHVTDGQSVPMMGVHWVDSTAPEFNDGPFERTFIYGSYEGDLIFLEPMITTAFMESLRGTPPAVVPVKRPARFPRPGLYPSSYTVRHDADADAYVIALSDLSREVEP